MIGFLRGVPLAVRPDSVLLDVGGVGYAVVIPLSTYYELERHGGGEVGLFIHTHLREDGIALYGFWSEREKLLFEKLIGVAGVGPRLARAVLSGLPLEDLLGALVRGETARLVSIPGVGRKTAERVVLELKDRLRDLLAEAPSQVPAGDGDVVSALVNLGYKPALAERAVSEARRESRDAEFHELLRASLKRLSRASK